MQKLKKEVVMMSIKQKLTGKPSIDRPWMQYYPQEMIENLTVYIYWYFSSITSSVLNTLSFLIGKFFSFT